MPKNFKPGMRVPARIYGSNELIHNMDDAVFSQLSNVSMLPGIVKHAMCMPDGHSGYGFPIGGAAAIDISNDGVISPGGIGFDINRDPLLVGRIPLIRNGAEIEFFGACQLHLAPHTLCKIMQGLFDREPV